MRALVLGAGGQLGQELTSELTRRGHSVEAVAREQLDVTVDEAVDGLIDRRKPDWVFNAAAYNKVDLAEREFEKAMRVNGFGVRTVARAAQRVGAALVHYSTDHVFDGTKRDGSYGEDDRPMPPSAYGVSKLAGEHFARIGCERAWVVRVAGVFGPAGRLTRHGNFVETVLRKAAEGKQLKVVEDFFSTPTYAVPLAARSIDLLEKAEPGLYHIGGGETVSWFDYAGRIMRLAGVDGDLQPTNRREFVTPARRPRHSGLSNAKIESLGLEPMPALDDAVRDYLERRPDAA